MTALFSSIRDMAYSLFQKYRALSATYERIIECHSFIDRPSFHHPSAGTKLTWKCGLETHLAICRNSDSWILANCGGSMTSKISSISPKNMTSFCEQVFGQNFSKPLTTGSVNTASFSRNCTTQYANWAWYNDKHFTLWSGNRTLTRNCLCSDLSGNAKPLIMLKWKLKVRFD